MTKWFLFSGQEYVADNQDGAHMRGLNANMIDDLVADESANQASVEGQETNHHELNSAGEDIEDVEEIVRCLNLFLRSGSKYCAD